MDDDKLADMVSSLKRSSDKRGKRGGLGSDDKASSKRVVVDKSTEDVDDTDKRPQPFIKFVRAKTTDILPQVKKSSALPKARSQPVVETVHVAPKEDVKQALEQWSKTNHIHDYEILNSWGQFHKVKLRSRQEQEEETKRLKDVSVVNITRVDGETFESTVVETPACQLHKGTVLSSKAGPNGLELLVCGKRPPPA